MNFRIEISNNIKMEYDNGKMKLTLGNLTDAGWFWSGDDSDLMGFMIRCKNSKYSVEFARELDKQITEGNITLLKIKTMLLNSLKTGNGLYEISGDNNAWYFGNLYDSVDYESYKDDLLDEFPNLTNEQLNEIIEETEENVNLDYEDFEKENIKDYKRNAKYAILKAQSISGLFLNLNLVEDEIRDAVYEWQSEISTTAFIEARNHFVKNNQDVFKLAKAITDKKQKKLSSASNFNI